MILPKPQDYLISYMGIMTGFVDLLYLELAIVPGLERVFVPQN